MRNLKGIFSALLVSFNEDGSINEKGLREIIRYNIDKMKIDGLYVGGSTGENFMLSTEEKKQIFRIAKDEAKDQVALIAQVGSVNLHEAVELGKYATELGYDSLSAVTPFYYKFSFPEIKHYYDTIIAETGNNMIVYSIPFLTGQAMPQGAFDALVSITFNAGCGNLKNSTLFKMARKGYSKGMCGQFERWIYANGVPLKGLIERRQKEKALCLGS